MALICRSKAEDRSLPFSAIFRTEDGMCAKARELLPKQTPWAQLKIAFIQTAGFHLFHRIISSEAPSGLPPMQQSYCVSCSVKQIRQSLFRAKCVQMEALQTRHTYADSVPRCGGHGFHTGSSRFSVTPQAWGVSRVAKSIIVADKPLSSGHLCCVCELSISYRYRGHRWSRGRLSNCWLPSFSSYY